MVSQLVQQCETTRHCDRPGQVVIILSSQGFEICYDGTSTVVNVQRELVAMRGYTKWSTIPICLSWLIASQSEIESIL